MSKAVLISIRPEWCKKILAGVKTIEVRKTRPKIETPFKCYIYQTRKPVQVSFSGTGRHISEYDKTCWYNERSGKVIGEFVCDEIVDISISCSDPDMKGIPFPYTALTDRQIMDYLGNGKTGYGWHISDLKIYDKPKDISDFMRPCLKKEDDFPLCLDCERLVKHFGCGGTILRPPQSWCYVEEAD